MAMLLHVYGMFLAKTLTRLVPSTLHESSTTFLQGFELFLPDTCCKNLGKKVLITIVDTNPS